MKRHLSSRSRSSKSSQDSLYNFCTPIEQGEEGEECEIKKYHPKSKAKHNSTKSEITPDIPNINNFLEIRKNIFGIELPETISSIPIDCITITGNDFFINKAQITNNKDIKINGYLSNGCYGSIFIASHTSNKYVIKFMNAHVNNINEIKAMIDIRNALKEDKFPIPNFLYMAYYYFKCNKFTIDEKTKKTINSQVSATSRNIGDDIEISITRDYSLIVLEYFDDTIKKLLPTISSNFNITESDKREIYNSIFSQMILALYILHNKFNYIHNDAHLENFLYKTVVKENNYFHYNINGQNYYIKNCGYLVALSDYGLCRKSTDYDGANINKKKFKDYFYTITQLLRNISTIKDIDPSFYDKYIKEIIKNCGEINFEDHNEKIFLDTILTSYLGAKQLLSSKEKTINNEPYIC
jgi:hypothetical protein